MSWQLNTLGEADVYILKPTMETRIFVKEEGEKDEGRRKRGIVVECPILITQDRVGF
jgi:hypothetical protein